MLFTSHGFILQTRVRKNMLGDMNASDPESQIASFLARYSPAIEAQLKDARRRLRAFFPRGYELVFDNYNALVFGISPTERASEAFISIAGYPKWVTLFFLNGTALNDPHGLLEGQGKKVRSIRLTNSSQINEPEVEALISQAIVFRRAALLAAPALATRVNTVVAKQRPRRPAAAKAASVAPKNPSRAEMTPNPSFKRTRLRSA
jgi:hypothetical protein